MPNRVRALSLVASLCVAQPSAADAPDDARRAEVVVSLDGDGARESITIGELEDTILAQNPVMQARYTSASAVRAFLDQKLRFELLAAEAARRGYGENAAVVQAQREGAVQSLIKRDFDDTLSTNAIAEADIRKYYDEHRDEFVRGEGRRASLLLVSDETAAKALLERARTADVRAFRELVRGASVDQTSKQRGGDLSYFDANGKLLDEQEGTIDPALAKAAFALREVGDTSDVVPVGQSRGILRLTGIRPAEDEPFTKAEERLRMRLWRERRQAAIDAHTGALKKQLNVVVHPELVDAVKLDAGPPLPPSDGLPSGFPHIPLESPSPDTHEGGRPR